VVVVGFAVGLEAVEVKPDGLDVHEYVSPLTVVAPIEVLPPKQITLLLPAIAKGNGFTVITTESDFIQPVAAIVSVK